MLDVCQNVQSQKQSYAPHERSTKSEVFSGSSARMNLRSAMGSTSQRVNETSFF